MSSNNNKTITKHNTNTNNNNNTSTNTNKSDNLRQLKMSANAFQKNHNNDSNKKGTNKK